MAIVAIPRHPGESIDARIVRQVDALSRAYRVKITDGYARTGHAANGEHPKGLAVDVIPDFARGGTWADVDRLAKRAEPQQNRPSPGLRWVGYDGDAGHGKGHHLHLSWDESALGKAAGSLGLGAGGLEGAAAGALGAIDDAGGGISGLVPDVPGPDDVAGAIVGKLADAVGEVGVRVLLYMALTAGGAALVFIGVTRAASAGGGPSIADTLSPAVAQLAPTPAPPTQAKGAPRARPGR